jgi:metal-responsive CopG/Arc/MetJ family transcriptional regulator
MKQYSFSFNPDVLEDFKKALPVNKSKKMLKNYLLNEYELPESLDELLQSVSNPAIQPYWMTEVEINKIDRLIKQAKIKGYTLNRSSIMRDIMKKLLKKYRDTPIQKSEQYRQRFKVPVGTKNRFSQLIKEGELTYELSSFIMDGYVPSNDFTSMRNQEQEDLNFKSDIEVFEKMDEISTEYGFKKGGRAKIFRDALVQFEALLQSNPPKKAALKQELKYILDEYKNVENVPVIQEEISKYLKE